MKKDFYAIMESHIFPPVNNRLTRHANLIRTTLTSVCPGNQTKTLNVLVISPNVEFS